jgi:hypothetical protein
VAVATAGGQQMSAAVEAKWVTDGWRSEARAIEGKYRSGIVATKNVLDLNYPRVGCACTRLGAAAGITMCRPWS